jgi:hypothetical protein
MKILDITGNPFSTVLNNGKTHEALFSAFKRSELCQLYTRPVDNNLVDFKYCNSFYCVSDLDVLNRLRLKIKKCGGEVVHSVEPTNNADVYDTYQNGGLSKHQDILRLLRDIMWHTNVWKNSSLKTWIEKEKPDVIFVDGGGECFLFDIALYIAGKWNIPIISYYTDDYLITPVVKGVISFIRHILLKKTLQNVINQSSLCYTIGEDMANEYGRYFNREFLYIMNSIPLRDYVEPQHSQKPISISYFGSLGLNRGKMIGRLSQILGDKAKVIAYTFGHLSEEEESSIKEQGVDIRAGIKGEEFHKAVYDSDVLLHVESDDKTNRAFTRLAVSTKIPEYLMHSRPVLGFGPTEVASMRLLSNNHVGLVVSSEYSEEEIREAVSSLYDLKKRIEFSQRGYNFACEVFDRRRNALKFKEQIENTINV